MKNNGDFPQIPLIEKEIIDAVNEKNLVVFIGAGVSRLVGCQGWDDLADSLIDSCFSNHLISQDEWNQLKKIKDRKEKISIAYITFKKTNLTQVFFNTMEKSFSAEIEKNQNTQDIYSFLQDLGIIITTNADAHFDNYYNNLIIYKDFSNQTPIDPKFLYHIHGSIHYPDSIIFNSIDYLTRYSDSNFRSFLNRVFKDRVILFIGYGLAEFELLDFLITKNIINSANPNKMFFLKFYEESSKIIFPFERDFFESMKIKLIPYSGGRNVLYDTLKQWKQGIEESSLLLTSRLNRIRNSVKSLESNDLNHTLNLIEYDNACRHFFFQNLYATPNPIGLIDYLVSEPYFDLVKNIEHLKVNYENSEYFGLYSFAFFICKNNFLNQNQKAISFIKNIVEKLTRKLKDNPWINGILIMELISKIPESSTYNKQLDFIIKIYRRISNNSSFQISAEPIIEVIKKLSDNVSNHERILKLIHIVFQFENYSRKNQEQNTLFLIDINYKSLKDILVKNDFFEQTLEILLSNIHIYCHHVTSNIDDQDHFDKSEYCQKISEILEDLVKERVDSVDINFVTKLVQLDWFFTDTIFLQYFVQHNFQKFKFLFLENFERLLGSGAFHFWIWEILSFYSDSFTHIEIDIIFNCLEDSHDIVELSAAFKESQDTFIKKKLKSYSSEPKFQLIEGNPFVDNDYEWDPDKMQQSYQKTLERKLFKKKNNQFAEIIAQEYRKQQEDTFNPEYFDISAFTTKYPNKILDNITSICTLGIGIQLKILFGLIDGIKSIIFADKLKIFTYLTNIIEQDGFSREITQDTQENYGTYLILSLYILKIAFYSDEFQISQFNQARSHDIINFNHFLFVLIKILPDLSFKRLNEDNFVPKTPRFHILDFTFLILKNAEGDFSEKHNSHIKELITYYIDQGQDNADFWYILGKNYHLLFLLEPNYYFPLFECIFDLNKYDQWRITTISYLNHLKRELFEPRIFGKLSRYNHFEKILTNEMKKYNFRIIIWYLLWAYLQDIITLDDNLMLILIKDKSSRLIPHVFGYLENLKELGESYCNDKTEIILDKVAEELNKPTTDNTIINLQSLFLDHFELCLEFTNKCEKWLMLSATSFPKDKFESITLNKILTNFDSNPIIFSKICCETMQKSKLPTFHLDGVRKLLDKMIKAGEIDKSIQIINRYNKNGIFDFNDMIEMYNNKGKNSCLSI